MLNTPYIIRVSERRMERRTYTFLHGPRAGQQNRIRRSAINLQIKDTTYFQSLCQKAENKRDACLIAILYLSGRRIGEVLGLRKNNFYETDEFLGFETLNEKCFRAKPIGAYTLKVGERYYERIMCQFSKETEAYRRLGPFVLKHLEELSQDSFLFAQFRKRVGRTNINKHRAWQIITKIAPEMWPHQFRHQRFSQVTETLKNLPTADLIYSLKEFTKHHRTDSTLAYIHRMRNVEIMKKI